MDRFWSVEACHWELLLCSSHEEDNTPHTNAVALMMSKTAQRALTGWEAHGPRILKATFQIMKWKINKDVIQCFAPTNDSNEDVKEKFYCRLSTVIQNCPKTKHYNHDGRRQC